MGRRFSRGQRVAATTFALMIFGGGAAELLVRSFHLNDASLIVQVIGLPFLLVACFLAFVAVLPARSVELPKDLDETADQLATAVRRQWAAEARVRRLNDPYPLSVSWTARQGEAAVLNLLVKITSLGQRGAEPDPARWTMHSGGLIKLLLRKTPNRRLVVLGRAGAGKTVMLIRLLLRVLNERTPGDPVPVLVPLASWNPERQGFRSWVEGRLMVDYPALAEQAAEGKDKGSRIESLLDSYKIILLLDGLDEIPDYLRGSAFRRINRELPPEQVIAVSCRTGEYLSQSDETETELIGAVTVVLEDLGAAQVESYLRQDAGSAEAARCWELVFSGIRDDTPIASALRTPFMVSLARTIYSPRNDEPTANLPHPEILCDTTMFPDHSRIEKHLLDGLIAAAYRDENKPAWPRAKAERWLKFLARHLEQNLGSTSDLKWWELRYAGPRFLVGSVTGTATGVVAGIATELGGSRLGLGIGAGLLVGLTTALISRWVVGARGNLANSFSGGVGGGLLGGLCAGLIHTAVMGTDVSPTIGLIGGIEVGLAIAPIGRVFGGITGGFLGGIAFGICAQQGSGTLAVLVDGIAVAFTVGLTVEIAGRRTPARGMRGLRWSPAGLIAGGGVSLAVGLTLVIGLKVDVILALLTALITGLATGVVAGIEGKPLDLTRANSPSVTFANDLNAFWVTGAAAAGALGLMTGVGISPEVGLAAGFDYGLAVAFMQAAAGPFAITWLWLVFTRQLPVRIFRFLADAHEKRGVFRQVGSSYQFRHVDLQRRLAATEAEDPPDSPEG